MNRRQFLACSAAAVPGPTGPPTDIRSVAPDLVTPSLSLGAPATGKRVKVHRAGFGDGVYHVLYLPEDWRARPWRRYPIIVEYAGNGNFVNDYGDVSTGVPEGSNLGYGISGGKGYIWLCLPYVDSAAKQNAITWWGDPDATIDYCLGAVKEVVDRWRGDRSRVLLAGFSRGAIACNYIGLRNDAIAKLWRGFVCYSQYDGVRTWPYPDSDRASALARLKRLGPRPQFICDENGIELTQQYVESTGVRGNFGFHPLGFRNHNDAWTLRPIPLRKTLRDWTRRVFS
jgi:hypothetical protein